MGGGIYRIVKDREDLSHTPPRVLATLRKSITKLETAGQTAFAFVLHHSDWEGVELALSSQQAIEHLALPYDPATRRLFGVPVVVSNAQAAVWLMPWPPTQ